MTKTALALSLGLAFGSAYGEDSKMAKPAQPDNSQVNTRDANRDHRTADDQAMAPASDTELVRKIRESLTKNDSLSTYGKNVKILATGGMVTLRGPVKSDQERTAIENAAKTVAGASQVKNELEVAR